MRDLPRPGLEPMSPALAGGFLTTAPPGKVPQPRFVSVLIFCDENKLALLKKKRKEKDTLANSTHSNIFLHFPLNQKPIPTLGRSH